MARTLGSLTGGSRGGAGGGQGAGVAAAAAARAAAVADLEGNIRVTADAPTNSLIILASAEGFAAIRDVIEALDVRRPQVMIEALIMEVNVTDGTRLGISWLYQGSQSSATSSRGSVGFDSAGAPSDLIGTAGQGTLVSAILGKTVDIFVDGVKTQVPVIQAAITAAAENQDLNLISAPILLTADNEAARIVVGQNIPVPTTRLQAADAGEFTTSQNIERQDVGVTLRVTPQISQGDTVRLEIFQQISDVVGGSDELGPVTTNREVENVVYVRDGEAVMIGGILTEVQTETVTKVPWLGDIPILGWAFKSTNDALRKINLLLILTPRIVRSAEDLEQLTLEQREKFRDAAASDLTYSPEEREQRRRALEAGVPLPNDENPTRPSPCPVSAPRRRRGRSLAKRSRPPISAPPAATTPCRSRSSAIRAPPSTRSSG
ncbi:MAG: hypothetical protein JRG82_06015, partial [Deltaproteobacteria bacterium]|nr:hypothetical protein [Deltaproteobacteria bacterium]